MSFTFRSIDGRPTPEGTEESRSQQDANKGVLPSRPCLYRLQQLFFPPKKAEAFTFLSIVVFTTPFWYERASHTTSGRIYGHVESVQGLRDAVRQFKIVANRDERNWLGQTFICDTQRALEVRPHAIRTKERTTDTSKVDGRHTCYKDVATYTGLCRRFHYLLNDF